MMTVTWLALLEEEGVEVELHLVEVLVEQEVEEGHSLVEEGGHSSVVLEVLEGHPWEGLEEQEVLQLEEEEVHQQVVEGDN